MLLAVGAAGCFPQRGAGGLGMRRAAELAPRAAGGGAARGALWAMWKSALSFITRIVVCVVLGGEQKERNVDGEGRPEGRGLLRAYRPDPPAVGSVAVEAKLER